MEKIRELCRERTFLSEEDMALLEAIGMAMGQMAKMEEADIYIDCLDRNGLPLVVAEEKSELSIRTKQPSWLGRNMSPANEPGVVNTLLHGVPSKCVNSVTENGVQYIQSAEPVFREEKLIGALVKEQRIRSTRDLPQRSAAQSLGFESSDPVGIAEYIDEGIIIVDASGKVKSINGTAKEIYERLGYDMDCILGRSFESIRLIAVSEDFENKLGDSAAIKTEINGMHLSLRHFYLGDDSMLVIIKDLTNEVKKDSELVVKSVMINEIHHRIKNNLQTVASLLNLQKRRSGSDEVKKCLEVAVGRISSIAATHELFSLQDTDFASLHALLQAIRQSILSCVDLKEKRIEIDIGGEDVFVSSKTSGYLAIIVNELIQNCMKHAFTGRDTGRIEISVSGNDRETTLFVKDDGVGFKENKMRKEGLGLNIVRSLANENLDAAFFIDADDCGTQASICIPNRILKN